MSVYSLASDFATKTNRSIFITGKAGTGKTTFLHQLRNQTDKQMAVVAPTGVAAINAGGVTMHSFFQLPLGPFIPTEEGKRNLLSKQRMNKQRRSVLRELELLVIDEISMVRADLLDAVDAVLRSIRHRHNEPFGGVQVIFIGDMFQLSPVARDHEWRLLSDYYDGVYFFHSHVLKDRPPVYIEFDKIFRQSDDQFIELLNQVRNDRLSRESFDLLQTRFNPSFRPSADEMHITLTTHNYKADAINREELDKLPAKMMKFEAVVKGDFSENSFPTEKSLELKSGARVMFIKNDSEVPRRFYNGKIGTVTLVDDIKNIIYVQPADKDEEPIAVERVVWENIRYSTNAETLAIDEEIIGTFTQFPLRLAWAVTIHKSQGLTFDKAIIDAGASFAPGQVYVALSRCRALEGITLLSPINSNIIKNDQQVVEFSSQTSEEEKLHAELVNSRLKYQCELLQNLFDFRSLLILSKVWYNTARDGESTFGEDALPFINDIIEKLNKLEAVGMKFSLQLESVIFEKSDVDNYISSRLKAAAEYFIPLIDALISCLHESPATTDNYQASRKYDDTMLEIFSSLAQKREMIENIPDDFSIENYFKLRKKFILPPFPRSSYSKSSTGMDFNVEHPDLLSELISLRNRLSDDLLQPVYMIASMKTLKEMAHYLPMSEKQMLKISGVGKIRFDRFGELFLSLIVDYCKMNSLTSKADELPESKKKRTESNGKRVKGASANESYELWKSGHSIAEIAVKRSLVESTIAGHLASFIERGEADILQFVSSGQLSKAEGLVASKADDVSVYAVLSGEFNPVEIRLISAWMKKKK